MKTEQNQLYECPITEVIEVKPEGVICQSGLRKLNDYDNGGDPFYTD